jgi:mannose-6-phosphate isomerase
MLYPLTFRPIYKERIWGGRTLETVFGRELPSNLPIGESWELSDRPGDISIIESGPFEGKDLHWLVENHTRELLGEVAPQNGRFPLLIKFLDAQEKLSLQVHPPHHVAQQLRGEPKTEMWYLVDAKPGADLYVGLRRGINRASFEQRVRTSEVAECFHRVPVRAGDAMFVPSGRVHAIGAGCLICEVQQNSDTTYRVFDWNRTGPDGQARALHIPEALASIDFEDFEPALVDAAYAGDAQSQVRPLVKCPYFEVEVRQLAPGVPLNWRPGPAVAAVLKGTLQITGGDCAQVVLGPGRCCLIPACLREPVLSARTPAEFLLIRLK